MAEGAVLSLNQLVRITGRSYRTIRKRLEGLTPVRTQGRAHLYDTQSALERIFGEERSEDDVLDLSEQRARLAREQADGQALKNAELRGELVRADDVRAVQVAVITALRTRLLAVPVKVSHLVAGMSEPNECRDAIEEAIREALEEIADTEVEGVEA